MSVITISREFGSGGAAIAQRVAQTAALHLADKQLIGAVLAQYGVVEFDREYDSIPSFWDRFDERRMARRDLMVDMLNRTLLAFARHGDMVILGRCGYAALGGYADVLNVRVQAPLAYRIKRVMEQQGIAEFREAERVVKEGDKARLSLIEDFHQEFQTARWDFAPAFDLVLDTSKISADLAVATIVEAAKALPMRNGGGERLTRAIAVTLSMASAVASVLKCEVVHGV
jgi:cytidylate kinase